MSVEAIGVIAAGSEQSAAAGREVFLRGGNAADAAVAGAFAAAAGDPAIVSLAGGGLLIHRCGTSGEVGVCDFFSTAPGLGADREEAARRRGVELIPFDVHFGDGGATQRFFIGRGAAAVPGVLRGLEAAQRRWGKLPLSTVLAPSIRFLREGVRLSSFQVECSAILAEFLRRSALGRDLIDAQPGLPRAVGDLWQNRALAGLLERISRDGLSPVETDVITPAILDAFGIAGGGRITSRDLDEYAPRFSRAREFSFCGTRIATVPLPAFGGWFVETTLSSFEKIGVVGCIPESANRLRRIAEIFRAISEERAETPDLVDRADARDRLNDRVARIRSGESAVDRRERRTPGNTTHVSAVDAAGNAAAVTMTYGEGNGYEIPGTGILMNNLLGEEDLFPAGFGSERAGERLRTMMAPTIVVDPSGGVAALGAGGSSRIRTVIPQVLLRLLADGESLTDSVERARIHVENGVLSAETYALDDPASQLAEARGVAARVQEFTSPNLFFGGVHAVRRTADGRLEGAGDPRRSGTVIVTEG